MAKYRNKPVEVEAFQWCGEGNDKEYPGWYIEAIKNETIWICDSGTLNAKMFIRTPEGYEVVRTGDYIVQDITGEMCTCEQKLFEKLYVKV